MRNENLDKVFLPCFAHQMNLCIGDIFKESERYKTVSIQAVAIVSFFNSSTYFLGKLKQEQIELNGHLYALQRPCETRWNSHYFCIASILKTETALKVR
jgi:hypothetical protein